MIKLINSYRFAVKYVIGVATKKIPKDKYKFVEETYLGPNNQEVPIRIYYSHKVTKKTIIICNIVEMLFFLF